MTETLGYDGGRAVTVYVRPAPPEAAVCAGNGQSISRWGAFLETADVPSTMIVGVHRWTHVRFGVALRDGGADVIIAERVGSHGPMVWRREFPRMAAWAFGSTARARYRAQTEHPTGSP